MPAAWDEVTLRTWPRGTENIFALRDLEMYDAEGKRLSAASSSWVVLDYGTRRVQRPDKALSHLNTTFPDARALTRNAAKIPAVPADNQQITRLTAAPGDIDVNLHVNNARYIEWVTDSYDPQFLSSHTPYAIDVNYLSEGHYGDNIAIIKAEEGGSERSCFHSVIREEDNVELCRIRIKWKEGIL